MNRLDALRMLAPELGRLGDAHAVPLGACHLEGSPRLVGSGFFFRCGEAWFLVSAEHVLRDLRPPGADPQVPCDSELLVPGPEDSTVYISGRITASPRYDVAVLRVSDPSVVAERWAPITVADLAPEDDPPDSWFHVTGWPTEYWARRERIRFTGDGAGDAGDYDIDREIMFRLDTNEFSTLDGHLSSPPALQGVSGAPVWRVFRGDSSHPEVRFAGVEKSFHRDGPNCWIRATRWGVLRALIERSAPGVFITAERLVFPR